MTVRAGLEGWGYMHLQERARGDCLAFLGKGLVTAGRRCLVVDKIMSLRRPWGWRVESRTSELLI